MTRYFLRAFIIFAPVFLVGCAMDAPPDDPLVITAE